MPPKARTADPTQDVGEINDEEMTDENTTIVNTIDKLQECGINAADILKLKSAGMCTVKGLLMTTRKELGNIKGLSEAKIEKMLEAAQKIEGWTWMTGKQIEDSRVNIVRVTTGCSKLDELLGGGVEAKSITEV